MKRIISIILVTAMILTSATGCNKKDTEKQIAEVKITLPASTGIKATVEGEAVITTQVYLLARAYFEKLENYDMNSFNAQEYSELLAKTTEAFRIAEALCNSLEKNAAALAKMEESGDIQQEKSGIEQISANVYESYYSPFVTIAYAAEEKSPAVRYAEELTKTFDNAKNGQKLKAVAEKYGTDVKKAKAMLDQAQAILEGAAYEDQAAFENKCYQAAVETKAAASTIGFGVGFAATMGTGFAAASFIEGGGLIMSGVSAIIDTGTAVTIHTTNGEGDEYTAAWEKTSAIFAPVSAAFAIGGGIQNIKDFRDPQKAKDMVDNAAQAFLTGVGFARDYIQEGTVLGVSADVINGYRQIIVQSADTSNPEAAKKILENAGIKENAEIKENADATADAYIEALGDLVDPETPIDIEAVLEAIDTAISGNTSDGSTPAENIQEAVTEAAPEEAQAEEPQTEAAEPQAAAEDISGTYNVTELRFVQMGAAGPYDEKLHITLSGDAITLQSESNPDTVLSGTYDAQSMTAELSADQSRVIVEFDGTGKLLYSEYNTNDGVLYIEMDAEK